MDPTRKPCCTQNAEDICIYKVSAIIPGSCGNAELGHLGRAPRDYDSSDLFCCEPAIVRYIWKWFCLDSERYFPKYSGCPAGVCEKGLKSQTPMARNWIEPDRQISSFVRRDKLNRARGHLGRFARGDRAPLGGVSGPSRFRYRFTHMGGMRVRDGQRPPEFRELVFRRLPEAFGGIGQGEREYSDHESGQGADGPLVFVRPVLYTNGLQMKPRQTSGDGMVFIKGAIGVLVFAFVYAFLERR